MKSNVTEAGEMIDNLIKDLASSAKKRKEGVHCFTEELVILRLKEILKTLEKDKHITDDDF